MSKKQDIMREIKNNPDKPYAQIASEHGVSRQWVWSIANSQESKRRNKKRVSLWEMEANADYYLSKIRFLKKAGMSAGKVTEQLNITEKTYNTFIKNHNALLDRAKRPPYIRKDEIDSVAKQCAYVKASHPEWSIVKISKEVGCSYSNARRGIIRWRVCL